MLSPALLSLHSIHTALSLGSPLFNLTSPTSPHIFRGLTVWHDHFVDFAFALDIGSGCGSLCSLPLFTLLSCLQAGPGSGPWPSAPSRLRNMVNGSSAQRSVSRHLHKKFRCQKRKHVYFRCFLCWLPLATCLSPPFAFSPSLFIIIIFLKSNRRRAAIISICSPIDCRLWAVACQIEATLWEEQQEEA